MVVIRQTFLYSRKGGCSRAEVVVFGEKVVKLRQIVVLGQKLFYSGKVVVFGKKCLYSCIVIVFGQSGCNRTKVVLFW